MSCIGDLCHGESVLECLLKVRTFKLLFKAVDVLHEWSSRSSGQLMWKLLTLFSSCIAGSSDFDADFI